MDDVVEVPAQDKLAAPVNAGPSVATGLHPEIQDAGRNAVFAALVKGDQDITGLVAYSIFKQNELDWLSDFRNAKGREPSDAEADAYIIGESTPRRLATYRHLADATLGGAGPDVASAGASGGRSFAAQQPARPAGGFGVSAIVYFVLAIVVLVAVYYAARYGVPKVGG